MILERLGSFYWTELTVDSSQFLWLKIILCMFFALFQKSFLLHIVPSYCTVCNSTGYYLLFHQIPILPLSVSPAFCFLIVTNAHFSIIVMQQVPFHCFHHEVVSILGWSRRLLWPTLMHLPPLLQISGFPQQTFHVYIEWHSEQTVHHICWVHWATLPY